MSEWEQKGNKAFRLLDLYERMSRGEAVQKIRLAEEFGVSPKTVQRDLDDLRAYLTERHFSESDGSVEYDRSRDRYYLIRSERNWITNEEVLALSKILLESRAFCREELNELLFKLMNQISPTDRPILKRMIGNEAFHYVPPRHQKKLLSVLWKLTKSITRQRMIEFRYARQDGRQSLKTIKPVSVLFSEMYFYLIGYARDGKPSYPIVFRVDRMHGIRETGDGFEVPYRDRFEEGEFRKRVQFMYSGELKTVKFEYSGVLEALLDRLPTARILSEKDGVYTVCAETFGDGVLMWIRAQGNCARILPDASPTPPDVNRKDVP